MLINYDFAQIFGEFFLIVLYSGMIVGLLSNLIKRVSKNDFSKLNFLIIPFSLLLFLIHFVIFTALTGNLYTTGLTFSLIFLTFLVFYYLVIFVNDNKKINYYINRPKRKNYTKLKELRETNDFPKHNVNGKYTKTSSSLVFIDVSNEESIKIMEKITLTNGITVPKSSKENIPSTFSTRETSATTARQSFIWSRTPNRKVASK